MDYPIGYVRWTAKRNFEAVLDIMSVGKIDVNPLINQRIPFNKALKAYDIVLNENPLGIILQYEKREQKNLSLIQISKDKQKISPKKPVVGIVGAGNFAKAVLLLPALKKTDTRLKTIASSGGLGGIDSGCKFGFQYAASEYANIIEDRDINTVFIATRHNSHASLTIKAIENGKNVFVERPLCITIQDLYKINNAHSSLLTHYSSLILMVGFNRRFSQFTIKLKEAISYRKDPVCINIMVNAVELPIHHWHHDSEVGGGRIVQEGCHFIDLLRYIVGSKISEVYSLSTSGHSNLDEDKVTINLKFEDGSIGTIHYLANGNEHFPKERVEVFSEGKIFVIDNFKRLIGYGSKVKLKSFKQDKGHAKEVETFIHSISNGLDSPIPFEELIEVTLASFAAVKSARIGEPVKLHEISY